MKPRIPLLFLLLISFAPIYSKAETKPLELDQLIDPADQERIGLKKLSAEERELLRQYLSARFMEIYKAGWQTALEKAQQPTPAPKPAKERAIDVATPEEWEKLAARYQQQGDQKMAAAAMDKAMEARRQRGGSTGGTAGSVSRSLIYINTGGSHWISSNIERGAYIKLEDGSVWEIDRMDTINTMLWLSTEAISVAQSSHGSLSFDYVLINSSQHNKAAAKLVSQ